MRIRQERPQVPRRGQLHREPQPGHTIAEIVSKTGIARTSLYRHLPPRPPQPLTAGAPNRDQDDAVAPARARDQP